MIVFVRKDFNNDNLSSPIISEELSRYYNTKIQVYHHDNGAPYLVGIDKNISISHSNNILVYALSDQPLGIDIEKIKARNYTSIVAKMSWEKVNNLQEFYGIWTAYEAKYKAHGSYPTQTYNLIGGYIFTISSSDQQIKTIWL